MFATSLIDINLKLGEYYNNNDVLYSAGIHLKEGAHGKAGIHYSKYGRG